MSEWIDVKQKEPDPKEIKRILVYCEWVDKIHVAHWDCDEWRLSATEDDFPGDDVYFFHWMPLPEPPKEE